MLMINSNNNFEKALCFFNLWALKEIVNDYRVFIW